MPLSGSISSVSSTGGTTVSLMCLHLIIHLPLQLDDLVLHAGVELLQMLGGASFDLQLLQLPFGSPASERALDDDGGGARSPELLPLQPAADVLLDDHGLVVQEELRSRAQREEPLTNIPP